MDAPPVLLRDPGRRAFLLRKLHSLSGVVPLGFFLGMHLWTNAAALGGQAAYERAARNIEELPALPELEVLLVFLPLAVHALYGVALAFEGRPNAARYPFAANFWYVLQRVTGLVALGFVLWHLSEYRIPKLFGHLDAQAFYPMLSARLSSTSWGVPWAALGYLFGVTACSVHLANGLLGVCTSWGIVVSTRGRRIASFAAGAIGLGMIALGLATTFRFATGALVLP